MSMARSRFSPRNPVVVDTSVLPDRAKPSMKDSSDINFIMSRYLRTGNVDWLAKYPGEFGHVESQTFHGCMNVVAKAEQMFADLPSAVRKRFSNEPREFLAWAQDSKNLPEARKLGLAPPEVVQEPIPSLTPQGSAAAGSVAPSAPGTVPT